MSTPPLFSDETKSTFDKHIADRQQSEEQTRLLEQIAQIRAHLIELAHDAIIVRDPASTIIYWNRGAQELYGWTAQEAIGQVSHKLLSTHFPVSRETIDALLATGEQWEGELVHTTKDGRQVIVESRQRSYIVGAGLAPALDRTLTSDPAPALDRAPTQDRTLTSDPAPALDRAPTLDPTHTSDPAPALDRTHTSDPAPALDRAPTLDRAPALDRTLTSDPAPALDPTLTSDPAPALDRESTSNSRNQPIAILEINRDITERKFKYLTERERAEEDQLRLAAIVESSDDAIVSKTLDGIITSWNLAAERMFGYTAQEAIGKHIFLIIPPELRGEEETILSKLRKGEHIDHFETVRIRKDRTRINVSLSISPIKNKAGQIIGASKIARDITDRKRLQQNLQFLFHASKVLSSSLDYKMTLQTIANLAVPRIADWCTINMVAADGSIEQLVIAHADPQKVQWARELSKKYPVDMNATHGIPQVLRTGVSEFAPFISDDVLVAAAVDDEQLALLRNIGFTSGMTIPLLVDGKAIGAVTFALAESARRYTQADLAMAEELASRASLAIQNARLYWAMQQSRDQLDIILRGVADGIIVYDTHNHIIYANESAARMTGSASVQEMMETPSAGISSRYEIIDEQRQPFPRSQFTHQRVLAGEREAEAVMGYKNTTTTGQPERWLLVKSRPVLNERGEVTMVVTIVHDITERVLAEQRKDEFISMTSHELKTPITSLKGFTNVLQRRLAKQGDQQGLHYLARIDAQLNKLTKLVIDLLDISRMQIGKLAIQIESFDLDNLVAETIENVQAATSTHSIILEGKTDAQIVGDKDRLGQVFINLLTNAVKYSPRADKVIVRLFREQKQAIVSVQDFGIGIDEAQHQKIFERFYQVTDPEERTYPGLGIGLYISKEIVERHSGRITIQSRKGKGATFSVALPLLQEGES